MNFEKIRYGGKPKPISLQRDDITLRHDLVEDGYAKAPPKRIVEILNNRFHGKVDKMDTLLKAITEDCGCVKRTASTAIKKAVEAECISKERVGRNMVVRVNK